MAPKNFKFFLKTGYALKFLRKLLNSNSHSNTATIRNTFYATLKSKMHAIKS